MKIPMKTKPRLFSTITILSLACAATTNAFAFYNPQTGRWLSRDPVTEPGFTLLVSSRSGEFKQDAEEQELESGDSDDYGTTVQTDDLLYLFVQNNPENLLDDLG